jgi:hypothetical protein
LLVEAKQEKKTSVSTVDFPKLQGEVHTMVVSTIRFDL